MALRPRNAVPFAAILLLLAAPAGAAVYRIDPAHSFVEFGVSHLGFGVVRGRFTTVRGWFRYDPGNPRDSWVSVTIRTGSLDTGHAGRDRTLRGGRFLETRRYPYARFTSTRVDLTDGALAVTGTLHLHGVSREVAVDAEFLGTGTDPWGAYRRGLEAHATIRLGDFGLGLPLLPSDQTVRMDFFIEGVRQQ